MCVCVCVQEGGMKYRKRENTLQSLHYVSCVCLARRENACVRCICVGVINDVLTAQIDRSVYEHEDFSNNLAAVWSMSAFTCVRVHVCLCERPLKCV